MGDHVSFSSFVGRLSDLNSYFQDQEKFLGVVNLFATRGSIVSESQS